MSCVPLQTTAALFLSSHSFLHHELKAKSTHRPQCMALSVGGECL